MANDIITSFNGADEVSTAAVQQKVREFGADANMTLTYPLNILKPDFVGNFLVFSRMKWDQRHRTSLIAERKAFSTGSDSGMQGFTQQKLINLYMPMLVENIQQNYDDMKSSMGAALMKAVEHSVDGFNSSSDWDGRLSAIGQGLQQAGGAIYGAAAQGALSITNSFNEQKVGAIMSPPIMGSYKGPVRRQQTFTYMFYPESLPELKMVAEIIKEFHRGTLPYESNRLKSLVNTRSAMINEGAQEMALSYGVPDIWMIEETTAATNKLQAPRYTPKFIFGPAAITNIRVNKTPDQYWKTFKGTASDASAIEIEITFAELIPITNEIYEADLTNLSSDYTEEPAQ